MKPRAPPLLSTRMLDQVREQIRCMHYSLATKKVYPYWVRFFMRWSGRNTGGQVRHPRDIDAASGTARPLDAFVSGSPPPPTTGTALASAAWHRVQDLSCAKIYA